MRHLFACAVLVLLALPTRAAEPELWFYYATNLQVDANVDKLEPVWRRAARAGYTKVMLADAKFSRLGDLGDNTARYFRNVDRVKTLAAELDLTIVPTVFPVGYSNDLLWHDPNLAEGLPVKDALFVVKANEARLVADPPVSISGKPAWSDDSVRVDGRTATVADNLGNARLVYKLAVAPFRCYHVSVQIRTDAYTGTPEIKALTAAGRSLQFASLGVRRTQDWTTHHAVFNSLDNKEVSVYLGVWGKASGTLQWKDWQVEEIGLLNVLRRPGTPVTVAGHTEGKDYDRIEDPRMGKHPWPGAYDVYHAPPAIKTRNLPDGARLRVSWYHPLTIHDGQVAACLSDDKLLPLLADQAKRVKAAFDTDHLMMSHDELRLANWDLACQQRHLDAGPLLAANVRACAGLLKGSHAYVWSDMFDPHHNAKDNYYLVRGDLAGSWEGLPKEVTVVNWNHAKRDDSLKFFASRGHRQLIAAYYDGNLTRNTADWLRSAAGVPGVVGFMYTTWRNDYADLEAFARLVRSPEFRRQ